jgi:hypothetical protein
MTPLTSRGTLRRKSVAVAEEIIRPNSRLAPAERLEIYNRQYWWRLWSILEKDFPRVVKTLGVRNFRKVATAYLTEFPAGFELSELGADFPLFLTQLELRFPKIPAPKRVLARQLAEMERALTVAVGKIGFPPAERGLLQPYVGLLRASYRIQDVRPTGRFRMPAWEMTHLAVHRFENRVYFKEITARQYALLSMIRREERWPRNIEPDVLAEFSALGWFYTA